MHEQTGELFLVREIDLESLSSSVLALQIQVSNLMIGFGDGGGGGGDCFWPDHYAAISHYSGFTTAITKMPLKLTLLI